MEAADVNNDIVHPEVRAHINSLVSALGGTSADDDGQYKLGDDALEVLRDLKRWIRFYDEKTNRMDVARCLAETNLVGGDLLQILAMWSENETENRFKARIALACFEIMVPLTWPIERDVEKMTVNHHRHLPVLQLAQLGYKRAIINFDGAAIMHTAVRAALPSMAMPIGDRTPRDQGIIKLVLFFLRNIGAISPPPGVKYEGDESQVSRSAVIDAFSYQDIFLTLLTIASNMGEDFHTEDLVLMEIIYHLVKRVDMRKLFLNEKDLHKAKANELTAMMDKEAAMLRSYKGKAPTRHNRFGTMIWVKRENGKMSTLSGQDALRDPTTREMKLDSTKTFRPPRRRKEEMEPKDLGPPVSLNARSNGQLRSFVEEFLDSGFNPLFQNVRKTIDREAPHLLHYNRAQFFYLVAWFLEAERTRRKSKKETKPSQVGGEEISSFNLVAAVLNQEMFITLGRALDRSYNDKDWQELTTVMRCFTQILLTVQEMSESGNEDDEEIADNILNRLFYEETTHDAVANIVRTYKDQGFEYLDACTELTHTYLRILESYSKQNVDLQVRSRKRTRRKKKAAKSAHPESDDMQDEGDDESANDEQNAERTSRERKFDFRRFAHRFTPQGVINTFVRFAKYYHDLDESQLKRVHRYFYRVAFKQEMSVMLFRVDILLLLYNMVWGPSPLDKNCAAFKDWEELVKQLVRKCVGKIKERPVLMAEMLFSKIPSTVHYLEHGYDKQTISTHPKPGAELEFKNLLERDQQIAIAVGVLLDRNQADHIDWVKSQLSTAESERRAWEAAEAASNMLPSAEADGQHGTAQPAERDVPKTASPITVRPDDAARRTAMFKNSHLRLLMKLVGFERLAPTLDETPDSAWIIPENLTADQLRESLDLIQRAEFSPPVFEEGELAENQLRRKSAAARKKRVNFDDDDVDDFLDDGAALFPAGGPTARKADDGEMQRRKRRKRGKKDGEDDDEEDSATEQQRKERARARRRRELEKARRIKSELYVHPSDDESDKEWDKEFFAKEEAIRQRVRATMLGDGPSAGEGRKRDAVSLDESDEEGSPAGRATRKRKSDVPLIDSDTDDEDELDSTRDSPPKAKRRRKLVMPTGDSEEEMASGLSSRSSGESEDEMDMDDTPLSSSPRDAARKDGEKASESSGLTAQPSMVEKAQGSTEAVAVDDDDDDDMQLPVVAKKRAHVRGGFIVDSSDEE